MNDTNAHLHFRGRARSIACGAARHARSIACGAAQRLRSITACAAFVPLSAAVLLGAAGCTGSLNDQDGLIGVTDGGLPDLLPPPTGTPGSGSSATDMSDKKSIALSGLDRRSWPLIVVETPAGQVEHQPTYFEPVVLARGPARVRGDAPTTATVLEGHSDGGSMVLEAAAAPFVWAGELLISPVRMVIQPPWTTLRAPAALTSSPTSGASATQWRWVEPSP